MKATIRSKIAGLLGAAVLLAAPSWVQASNKATPVNTLENKVRHELVL